DDDEISRLVLGEGQEIRFFTPDEALGLNLTPKLREFFEKYRDGVEKMIRKEEVEAVEVGLSL
ncbi:MAG TPA: hypothetical protein VEB60_00515, partial [Candidatus Paceibacterota bacterium]|nr:hypothetical protein [Candidatus Paceibacterota bacterium]